MESISQILSIIKNSYSFLVDDYGATMEMKDDYHVIFSSAKATVNLILDRANVGVQIISPEEEFKLDLFCIIGAVAPELTKSYPFPLKQISEKGMEHAVQETAVLMKKYCKDVLMGDFSIRKRAEEFKKEYLSSKGITLPKSSGCC